MFLMMYIILKQVFEGSWDTDTPVTHVFYTSVEAHYVRILPQEWHNHIGIRFELLGCRSKLKQFYKGLAKFYVFDDVYIILKQVFEGSWDRDTPVTHVFYTSVEAQYVRILPQEWHDHISI